MNDASIGFGSLFERSGDGTPTGTFAEVGVIETINPPEQSRDMQDATHLQSPGGWEEVIPGIKRSGELSLEFQYKSGGTVYSTMRADMVADAPGYYRITVAGGDTLAFYGHVQTIGAPTITAGEKMLLPVTIKVTGEPVYTAAP